jgi:hypothetical protein
MGEHYKYKYSITIHTDDLAVVNCLRALSQYSQKSGNNRITWGNTKDSDWKAANHRVTFRFTLPEYRDGYLYELKRLFPSEFWKEVGRSDSDPARPAK